jgi:hypothetical protein
MTGLRSAVKRIWLRLEPVDALASGSIGAAGARV